MGDVIDFFSRKRILPKENKKPSQSKKEKPSLIEMAQKKNLINKERMKRERAQNNKSLIKNDKTKQKQPV